MKRTVTAAVLIFAAIMLPAAGGLLYMKYIAAGQHRENGEGLSGALSAAACGGLSAAPRENAAAEDGKAQGAAGRQETETENPRYSADGADSGGEDTLMEQRENEGKDGGSGAQGGEAKAYVPAPEEVTPVAEKFLAQTAGEYVIAYYPSWAQYDKESLQAEQIDASKLTHLHYAFAETTAAYAPFADDIAEHEENLRRLAALRHQNPALKLVLSVGGAGGDKYFAELCASEESLRIFTEGCLDFLREYDFDGIDLDWEFPRTASETEGFTRLVLCLRYYMDALGEETGKHYTLSLAGAAESGTLRGIDYKAVEPFLDYVFIMGYNLYGPWNETAGFNAPLYAAGEREAEKAGAEEASGQNVYYYSLNSIVKTYLNNNIPARKLVLGLPFYGYALPVVSAGGTGLGAPLEKSSTAETYLPCRVIFERYIDDPAYTAGWDDTAQSPYLSGNNRFISYEDERSIAAKCGLVGEYGLAGAGFWELSQDTEDFRLLNVMYGAVRRQRKRSVTEDFR